VDDVEGEIDVEGDDLGAFGAAQFTEADALAEPCDSELSRRDKGRRPAEVEVDLAIERARHGKDSQALITALENKVQLLMVCQLKKNLHAWGEIGLLIQASGHLGGWCSVGVSHLSRGLCRANSEHRLLAHVLQCMLATLFERYGRVSNLQADNCEE
jgi:hypothetical protein